MVCSAPTGLSDLSVGQGGGDDFFWGFGLEFATSSDSSGNPSPAGGVTESAASPTRYYAMAHSVRLAHEFMRLSVGLQAERHGHVIIVWHSWESDYQSKMAAFMLDHTEFHLPAQWKFLVQEEGNAFFTNAAGDGLGIYFFDGRPDIVADVGDTPALRNFYREAVVSAGMAMLEVDAQQLAGIASVRAVFKGRLEPQGFAFLGSYTLPFAHCSFVIKVQSLEGGITGLRESSVMMMQEPPLQCDEESGSVIGWEKDAYDPSYTAAFLPNLAAAAIYDKHFPDHPLSRVSSYLDEISRELAVADRIRNLPPFVYQPPRAQHGWKPW